MFERALTIAGLGIALVACGGDDPSQPSTNTDPVTPANGAEVAPGAQPAAGAQAVAGASAGNPGSTGSAAGASGVQQGAAGASAGNAGSAGGTAGGPNAPTAGASDPGTGPMNEAGSSAGPMEPAPATPTTGRLPAIDDPWARGPFAVATLRSAGPARNATVLYPRDLGKDGLKHPIVVWDNGKGQTGLSIYAALLEHIASHGFVVYAAYSATDQGTELTQGLDWIIAQAGESGSPFFEKLDTMNAAAMGHSQGSIATFAVAADPRLRTTIHLSGGTNPDIAQGHETLPNLRNPTAFICGEPGGDGLIVGDVASEWCAYDFEHTDVPVFLAQISGASHISAPGMTLGACAAWLRWQLAGDTTQRAQFTGADCALCMRRNWMAKSKGL